MCEKMFKHVVFASSNIPAVVVDTLISKLGYHLQGWRQCTMLGLVVQMHVPKEKKVFNYLKIQIVSGLNT